MPIQPHLPPLLLPYLSPAYASSLALLTSTLGASTNWIVLRFVYAALKSDITASIADGKVQDAGETRVVLVSWLRDAAWWKEGGRKLGINPQKITFVDALTTGLGLGAKIDDVEKTILRAIEEAQRAAGHQRGKMLLVLDGLDFLLAASAFPVLEIMDMVGELREHVHSTILTSVADTPLNQSPVTPLEVSHAAFVMGMAHQARFVTSMRELDTGVAKDVSGVLRITRGPGEWGNNHGEEVEEREFLYFVGGDGGVRVFERGA